MSLTITSPNSVLANALARTIDFLRPRIATSKPNRILFNVGTQINGAPHLGTNLVQATAFVLAQQARYAFSLETAVVFGALDNAPFEIRLDPESHHEYQTTFYHALGEDRIKEIIHEFYGPFFDALSDVTDVGYTIQTYTEQQKNPGFRREFLLTLKHHESLRWFVAPSSGYLHIRLPCQQCGWAEKRAERTRLITLREESAEFESVCPDHGSYRSLIAAESQHYVDLATLYRNVVKESLAARDLDTLTVMIKGGDWTFGCQAVDGALALMGHPMVSLPMRVFAPQIQTDTGAKLSKSLIRQGKMEAPHQDASWVIDTKAWPGPVDDYADALIWLVELFMADPKHFFRSYCYKEIERIMNYRPQYSGERRPRMIRIYKKYFDMIAAGEKTIEVRVGYDSMKRIKQDDVLQFTCHNDVCLTKVLRVSRYESFEELFATEDPMKINPRATAQEQLADVREIFPPDREALGVLAIEIQKVRD